MHESFGDKSGVALGAAVRTLAGRRVDKRVVRTDVGRALEPFAWVGGDRSNEDEDGEGDDEGEGVAEDTRLAIVLKLGFFKIDSGAIGCILEPGFGSRSCGVERAALSFLLEESGVRGGVGANRWLVTGAELGTAMRVVDDTKCGLPI